MHQSWYKWFSSELICLLDHWCCSHWDSAHRKAITLYREPKYPNKQSIYVLLQWLWHKYRLVLFIIVSLFHITDAEPCAAHLWCLNNYRNSRDCLDPSLWIFNHDFQRHYSKLNNSDGWSQTKLIGINEYKWSGIIDIGF